MQKVTPLEPSNFYHIYNRGNGSVNIFKEETNYNHFLMLMDKHISPIAEVYAYCLLKNHFHFLIKIKNESDILEEIRSKESKQSLTRFLSQQFSNCFNAYTKAFNKMYDYSGSLFEERFRRIPIDNKAYLKNCITYIHKNPEQHGFVEKYDDWNHSSYKSHLSKKQTKLMRKSVIEIFSDSLAYKAYHQQEIKFDKAIQDIFQEPEVVDLSKPHRF